MTDIAAPLDDMLMAYLAERERQRAEAVQQTFAAMTRRERRLVREAAVMGYVQGARANGGSTCPDGWAVLSMVIAACLAFDDLYPVMAHIALTTKEKS